MHAVVVVHETGIGFDLGGEVRGYVGGGDGGCGCWLSGVRRRCRFGGGGGHETTRLQDFFISVVYILNCCVTHVISSEINENISEFGAESKWKFLESGVVPAGSAGVSWGWIDQTKRGSKTLTHHAQYRAQPSFKGALDALST